MSYVCRLSQFYEEHVAPSLILQHLLSAGDGSREYNLPSMRICLAVEAKLRLCICGMCHLPLWVVGKHGTLTDLTRDIQDCFCLERPGFPWTCPAFYGP